MIWLHKEYKAIELPKLANPIEGPEFIKPVEVPEQSKLEGKAVVEKVLNRHTDKTSLIIDEEIEPGQISITVSAFTNERLGCQNKIEVMLTSSFTNSDVIDRDGSFVAFANGIVLDTNTGLEWFAGPAKNTTLDEAKSWAGALSVNGGGWRVPTSSEVTTLSGGSFDLLKIQGWSVLCGPSYPGDQVVSMTTGLSLMYDYGTRAVAVRSPK